LTSAAAQEKPDFLQAGDKPRMVHNGNPVSKGIVIGSAFIFKKDHAEVDRRSIGEEAVGEELSRLDTAVFRAGDELVEVLSQLDEKNPEEAKIFKAHADILRDVEILKMVRQLIKKEHITAEWAVEQVYDQFISLFLVSENELTRARAADMKDVRQRLLMSFRGQPVTGLSKLPKPVIVVANDLLPSDTATIDREKVLAIVTEIGGDTSHTAILARGFGIPALLGVHLAASILHDGEEVIVDAVSGRLITDPTDVEKDWYREEARKLEEKKQTERMYLNREARTKDGKRIMVKVNLGSADAAELTAAPFSDGVGLLRTEFLYMQSDWLPGENEQCRVYSSILAAYREKPVILRTIDIGGDKSLPGLVQPKEANPFLGRRAIRLCFSEPDLFKTQLRAAFRASVHGDLWVMLPMVGCMEDIRRAKNIIWEVYGELAREDTPFAFDIKIGIMIEIPAIAMIVDQVVKEVDFASIGTNDLCQYLTAADRMNPLVAEYYQSCHPAMLRLIRAVAKAFNNEKKPVGVCGEMAADPVMASLLLGLGITSLSVNVSSLASIKSMVCNADMKNLEDMADACCNMSCAADIMEYCKRLLRRKQGSGK
jgi:phosphotransferase system enzyme I (PtsI)